MRIVSIKYDLDSFFSFYKLANAPHAGRWFPEAFQLLVANAYPLTTDSAGPPPPIYCKGLDPADPLLVPASNVKVTVDLRCGSIHVQFVETTTNVFFENTGGPFDVTQSLTVPVK